MAPTAAPEPEKSRAAGAPLLEQLHDTLELEVQELVAAGLCGCNCGGRLTTSSARRRYIDERHRQRAHRKRLEHIARALSIPARLSLEALRAPNDTGNRHADAQIAPQAPQTRKSRPRPGVTLYLPTIELGERLLAVLDEARAGGWDVDELERLAETALKRRRKRDGLTP